MATATKTEPKTDVQKDDAFAAKMDKVFSVFDAMEKRLAVLERPVYRDGASPDRLFAQVKGTEETRGGFKSLGHFARDVRNHALNKDVTPAFKSWITKAPAGMSETVGADGGFLVPPEFSMEILRRTYDNDLLKRTRSYPATGNSLTFPAIDETSRADGSRFGGVRAYWDVEAAQFTATKPALAQVALKLKKLIAICYATDELLEDAGVALEQFLMDLFAQEIAFKVGDSIINGTGAGMPQGILNAPALVSVSKEVGQAAATILFENINKMWMHMWAPSRTNAIWLVNQDTEAQLESMSLGIGLAGVPVYLPPGGVSEKPYATLKGRPVVPVEFAASVGTVGDVLLVDLSQYLTLRKGEVDQQSSIHFKFDTAEMAFRVMFRVDGMSWWTSTLTPFKGSNTMSPFIVLSTRS